MVNEGRSDVEIADALGITHNAVVGRRWRLGLARVDSAAASPSRSGKGRAPRRFSREEPASEPLSPKLLKAFEAKDSSVVPTSPHVTIIDLKESMCKWPLGDPGDLETFRYCGSPRANTATSGPYCAHHAKLAYNPQPARTPKARRQ